MARPSGDEPVVAAIDIGTNSIHLVVARLIGTGRFEIIAQEKEMVRLGSGATDMTELAPDAMDRAIDCLRRFRQVAEVSTTTIRAAATSATREASNQATFLERCRTEAQVDVDVISGTEEARLIHLGVSRAIETRGRRSLVIDIGGGSTEFAIGDTSEPDLIRSLKIGAIRLTEGFFADGSVTDERVEACRAHVRSFVSSVAREVADLGFDLAIGSSGTIGSLADAVAARRRDSEEAQNGFVFTRSELTDVVESILEAPGADERTAIPGIDAKRADIIVGGAVLLDELFAVLGIEEMAVSDFALREGLLFDTLPSPDASGLDHQHDLRRSSVEHLSTYFDEEQTHSRHVATLSLQLFDQLGALGLHDHGSEAGEFLVAGARLCNIGRFISHSAHHKHSAYLIRNTEHLYGFSGREIERIALVARYHRKSSPRLKHAEFAALSPDDRKLIQLLSGILRIAIGMDRSHAQNVSAVSVTAEQDIVTISATIAEGRDGDLDLYAANQRVSQLADVLGLDVTVRAETQPRP